MTDLDLDKIEAASAAYSRFRREYAANKSHGAAVRLQAARERFRDDVSPDVVLALIAELREARRERDAAERRMTEQVDHDSAERVELLDRIEKAEQERDELDAECSRRLVRALKAEKERDEARAARTVPADVKETIEDCLRRAKHQPSMGGHPIDRARTWLASLDTEPQSPAPDRFAEGFEAAKAAAIAILRDKWRWSRDEQRRDGLVSALEAIRSLKPDGGR